MPFVKGQVANPNGRNAGVREKLTRKFIHDLADEWAAKGPKVLSKLADGDPATFAKLVASLVPKEVVIDRRPETEIGDEELAALIDNFRSAVEAHGGTGTEETSKQAGSLPPLH